MANDWNTLYIYRNDSNTLHYFRNDLNTLRQNKAIPTPPETCDELSQYRNGDAAIVERKPVQLVVLIQESKAKEGRRRAVIGELPLSSSQVTC